MADLGKCSNKIENLLGILHMFKDFIFITNIKLGILFAGEMDS